MQFMYRGEIQVQENDLLGILKLSNELQVKGLSDAKLNSVVSKSFDATVKEEQSSINEQPTSQSECSTSVVSIKDSQLLYLPAKEILE